MTTQLHKIANEPWLAPHYRDQIQLIETKYMAIPTKYILNYFDALYNCLREGEETDADPCK